MHDYDTYRSTAVGIVFAVNGVCFGTTYYANLGIMSCQVIFYHQPLHPSRSEENLEGTVQINYKK